MQTDIRIIHDLVAELPRDHPMSTDAIERHHRRLINQFGWHPISDAHIFNLQTPPPGKLWGPRIVVLVNGSPNVAFYDPNTVAPNDEPIAEPSPYWRVLHHSAEWSRNHQPTHFLRPYRPGIVVAR
jgi:hypothetical protein